MHVGIVVCNYNVQKNVLPPWLDKVLHGLKTQIFPGIVDVVIVDNSSGSGFLSHLHNFCTENTSSNITFSYISENHHYYCSESMNLGFHLFKTLGNYDVIAYSSDDVTMTDPTGLIKVVNEFKNPQIGIVSAQVNKDNAEMKYKNLTNAKGSSVVIRLWEGVNMHFMLFSKQYMEAYDYRYIDFMYGFSIESLIPFLCAGIGKKWMLSRAVTMYNEKSRSVTKKKQSKGHPPGAFIMPEYHPKSLKEVLMPGHGVGLGFNLYNRNWKLPDHRLHGGFWMNYDESLYVNDECIDKQALYEFIVQNLFLKDTKYSERLAESASLLQI